MPDADNPSGPHPPLVVDTLGRVVRAQDGRGTVTWTVYSDRTLPPEQGGPPPEERPDDPFIIGE